MTDISIEHQETARGGRYVARLAGREGEAELVYVRRSPVLVTAVHTEAPVNLRGTGVAKALVERLVADARATGFRIVPACSYVAVQAEKNPAWSDVMMG